MLKPVTHSTLAAKMLQAIDQVAFNGIVPLKIQFRLILVCNTPNQSFDTDEIMGEASSGSIIDEFMDASASEDEDDSGYQYLFDDSPGFFNVDS